MTRTDFIHEAAVAFASNSALAKENFTTDYCTKLICDLATQLANKVGEIAEFDPEYSLQ